MEDVPETCSRDLAADGVPICPDGTSRQQTKETRTPLPAQPGRPAAYDFEYGRNGTANPFMMTAPPDGWRHVKVTDRRTRKDFARVPKDIADTHFPAGKTVPVTDSPNTHTLSTLYDTFEPAEAARIARRFEIHHTPRHGSWPTSLGPGSMPWCVNASPAAFPTVTPWSARSPRGRNDATPTKDP